MGLFKPSPKGWKNLSKIEREWAKDVEHHSDKGLVSAINNAGGYPLLLPYVLDNYTLTVTDIQRGIVRAAEKNSPDSLRLLHDYCAKQDHDFFAGWDNDFALFNEINSWACLERAWELMDFLPEPLRTPHREIALALVKNDYTAGIRELLQNKVRPDEASVFTAALNAAVSSSSDTLRAVLECAGSFGPASAAVEEALLTVIRDEDNDNKLRAFFDTGAIDIASDAAGKAFDAAATAGRLDALEFMVAAGIDAASLVPGLLPALAAARGDTDAVVLYLDGFGDGSRGRALEEAEKIRKDNERFALIDRDTLSEIKKLPTGGTLTLLFNFTTRQQIIVLCDTAFREPSMKVINFADIENGEAVERAREKLIELGGDAPAAENFKLKKPVLPRQTSKEAGP